jgi:hypothetical protein
MDSVLRAEPDGGAGPLLAYVGTFSSPLALGPFSLPIRHDPTAGLERGDVQRDAGVVVRRPGVDTGRGVDEADDLTRGPSVLRAPA